MTATGAPAGSPRLLYEELTARQRRRQVMRILLPPFTGTMIMIVLYYVLPFDRAVSGRTVGLLGIGLLGLSAMLALQVRQILRSDYPRLRGLGAMATSLPLFLLLFAATYFILAREQSGAFNQHLTRTDALYFTVTVFATVGFGDIVPTSEATRTIVMFQMIGGLVLIGLIGKLLLAAVSAGLARKEDADKQTGADRREP